MRKRLDTFRLMEQYKRRCSTAYSYVTLFGWATGGRQPLWRGGRVHRKLIERLRR